jgi:hypothetical protein
MWFNLTWWNNAIRQPRGGQAVAIIGIKPIRKIPQAAHCPNEHLWPSRLALLPSLTLLYAATYTNTPPLSTSPLLRLLLLTGTCPIHQYFLSDVSFPFLLTFLAPPSFPPPHLYFKTPVPRLLYLLVLTVSFALLILSLSEISFNRVWAEN